MTARETRDSLARQLMTTEPHRSLAWHAIGAMADTLARVAPYDTLADRHGGAIDQVVATLSPGTAPVAVGIATTERPEEFRIALRIQDRRAFRGEARAIVREHARDEVDVRYIGRIRAHAKPPWYRQAARPLTIGTSVAHRAVTAGTLGCFVTLADGRTGLLSANHVLANEGRANEGDPVLQPGPKDGGKANRDAVATLAHYVPLSRDQINEVDCAVAVLNAQIPFDARTVRSAGVLAGVATGIPSEKEVVEKLGRTTGLTQGRVTSFELTPLRLTYRSGQLVFDKLIEIEGVGPRAFSGPGDSGAVVMTAQERLARGMVIGGTAFGGANRAGLTYATSLSTVLDALGASLA